MIDLNNENWVEGFAKQAADLGLSADETKILMDKAATIAMYESSESFKEGFDKEAQMFQGLRNLIRGGAQQARPGALSSMASGAGQLAGGGMKALGATMPYIPAAVAGAGLYGGGSYLLDQGRELIENMNLSPQERVWKERVNAIRSLHPQDQVAEMVNLNKQIGNEYMRLAKMHGAGGNNHLERRRYW